MVFAADYPFLDVFWTMLIFFFWVIWIWILVTVLIDLFRRHDISGWGKAPWALFVIVLPYLGVFVYLITQGKGMAERRAEEMRAGQAAFDDHVRRRGRDRSERADREGQGAARQRRDRPGRVRPAQAQGARLSAFAIRPRRASVGRMDTAVQAPARVAAEPPPRRAGRPHGGRCGGDLAAALLAYAGAESQPGLNALARALMVACRSPSALYAWSAVRTSGFGLLLIAAGAGWVVTTLAESADAGAYTIGRVAGWLVEVLARLPGPLPSRRAGSRARRPPVLVGAMAAVVARVLPAPARRRRALQRAQPVHELRARLPAERALRARARAGVRGRRHAPARRRRSSSA